MYKYTFHVLGKNKMSAQIKNQ